MARWCRVFPLFVLAVAIARGSVTVSWNTHPKPQPSPAAAQKPTESARVTAVQGTHIVLRLRDGSTRTYVASPAQARLLQGLIGTVITFRVR